MTTRVIRSPESGGREKDKKFTPGIKKTVHRSGHTLTHLKHIVGSVCKDTSNLFYEIKFSLRNKI